MSGVTWIWVDDTEEIDHDYTEEITCPHCGYAMSDSWEMDSDGGTHDCGECGGEFRYSQDVTIRWSTEKVETT